MRIDAHVHMGMMGEKPDREEFLKRLKEAGMDGAAVFSPSPSGNEKDYRKRLERVIGFTKGEELLFPFFFLDPTQEDAHSQMEDALEAGVKGFKIICTHFYPSDPKVLEACRWAAEKGVPVMFHSGILYDGINVSGKLATEVVENATTGAKTMDELADEWNAAWTAAQEENGVTPQ